MRYEYFLFVESFDVVCPSFVLDTPKNHRLLSVDDSANWYTTDSFDRNVFDLYSLNHCNLVSLSLFDIDKAPIMEKVLKLADYDRKVAWKRARAEVSHYKQTESRFFVYMLLVKKNQVTTKVLYFGKGV